MASKLLKYTVSLRFGPKPTRQERKMQEKTRRGKTRQDKARQDKTWQGKTRHDKTRQAIHTENKNTTSRHDDKQTH